MRNNRNLLIIALIAIVNALGYGIIIPILYSYSRKFGLSDFENGLLFSIFTICQFISTPIIGRMSDKYGRRPLLIASILGTSVSFFLAAFAPSAIFLFIARALDGITAGNIPVASAVISDSTTGKQRAKGFGLIGASFGFGFVFGPAISALTVHLGAQVPFIIAGSISLIAVIITAIFLPETNIHIGEVKKGKLFDFPKMLHAMTDKYVGITLIISFLYSFAFGTYFFAFQPTAVKVLKFSVSEIAAVFTLVGFVGLLCQIFLVHRVNAKFGEKHSIQYACVGLTIGFFGLFLVNHQVPFLINIILIGIANSLINPLLQTLLSKETDEKSQGSIQGLFSAYSSIGMTVGPIVGGALALISIHLPFLASSAASLVCALLCFKIATSFTHKDTAF